MSEATISTPRLVVNYILGGLLAVMAAWYLFGGGLDYRASETMSRIEKDVASDAVAQYQIVKQHGDRVDICVHAGLVAAAFIQAKDESNYARWKEVERVDCRAAGVPRS
ncbi:hypothetical protein [Cupriavidus consociatus]|uniref:hypothetical protein n=1 Tax=Cupriavidus consociatus TaxID=2821357 RepID=UPI001AE51C82|nr:MULTISPECIES: hypothetical protein [unclassified Cupriavidus]MBP0625410.1 hypothetical protein [Cupriavidus sp. LEh25]MDK2662151.1 hypothetical protein [Cupriavidus sp. LEh21]